MAIAIEKKITRKRNGKKLSNHTKVMRALATMPISDIKEISKIKAILKTRGVKTGEPTIYSARREFLDSHTPAPKANGYAPKELSSIFAVKQMIDQIGLETVEQIIAGIKQIK